MPADGSTPIPTPPTDLHAIDVYVGGQLRTRRKAVGLSQTALAAIGGVTFQQLQKYERGVNRVSASMLYALAGGLGCAAADLFPPQDRIAPPIDVVVVVRSEGIETLAVTCALLSPASRAALGRIATTLLGLEGGQ